MSSSDVAAHEIRTSLFRLVRRLRQERPEGELSYSQFNVLGWLEREGPMTNADLAAAERVTPQTMMRATTDLVASEFISRADNPADRRQVLLEITPAGATLVREDRRRRDTFLAKAMDATLTPTEQELLHLAARLMDQLSEVVE
ncbi:DNA-binding MarR family transcriptional regulator [Kribbella rubisoli]|jgi:DNA-binding MarR family transcriptional regulator|uniref:DNA-binding MarR family transcriptional regulator n=1 Tax=Kribbella rubisoli TaxID=3075929 RepID=A0A4Q7XA80_9ACTN|nr:MarR family transcriptional regulator [Kribbella rubisoli]RZU20077.1 DNA-binding MarR family transcriptional regulator [Kribbella rubisoli]